MMWIVCGGVCPLSSPLHLHLLIQVMTHSANMFSLGPLARAGLTLVKLNFLLLLRCFIAGETLTVLYPEEIKLS